MQLIPIQSVPAQTFNVLLASQLCTITIRQLTTGLYIDLFVNSSPIIQGVICENRNRIVRDAYFGFIGDLAFNDTQGSTDPVSSGLGGQYVLLYLDATDFGSFT